MKFILISVASLCFLGEGKAQRSLTSADTILLRAISPVCWSIDFDCGPSSSHNTCVPAQRTWSGNRLLYKVDLLRYRGVVTVQAGPKYSIRSSDTINMDQWSATITFDTLRKELSFTYQESYTSAMTGGDFSTPTIGYTGSAGKLQAAMQLYGDYYPPECHCNSRVGWVTFGDASIPAEVDGERLYHQCKLVDQRDRHVLCSFTVEQRSIRFFDLLGRECDRVAIPAGVESVDYNTSRLAPGLFIAQLGQQAVKFVVR